MSKYSLPRKSKMVKVTQNMESSIERSVLRIMSFHEGRNQAITKLEILKDLKHSGFDINERIFRDAINSLRKRSFLIGSASTAPAGYYLISSRDEYDEFIDREIRSRIKDLRLIEMTLDSAAVKAFGVKQYDLFYEDE